MGEVVRFRCCHGADVLLLLWHVCSCADVLLFDGMGTHPAMQAVARTNSRSRPSSRQRRGKTSWRQSWSA